MENENHEKITKDTKQKDSLYIQTLSPDDVENVNEARENGTDGSSDATADKKHAKKRWKQKHVKKK